jgi:glycine betaine catabolism A
MRAETQAALIDQLRAHVAARTTGLAEREARVARDVYLSPAVLDAERALLRRVPVVVAHASEIAPGAAVPVDRAGEPLVLVRDPGGTLRGFLNVCRHRGTLLVPHACTARKALVCRYHAWTYDLTGRLTHVPQGEAFPSVAEERPGLVEVPVVERHGFVWTGVPQLGVLDEDLAGFGLASHHLLRAITWRRACNWKLVIDAFVEGYHVTSLHHDSIRRFFLDAAVQEAFGPHLRSAGARRELTSTAAPEIRDVATVFYLLFPNTVLVLHPDWISAITVWPDGVDHCRFEHRMLVPHAPRDDAERDRWDRSHALIVEQVFAREDLEIAEAIQAGLGAHADDSFRIGRQEHGLAHFHGALAAAIASSSCQRA